jgi:phosphohistidine phosphatase
MATELYFLRHADAGDPETWEGLDAARPLSARGHAQAERLARFLAAASFRPDAIVSSPKVRARETASIVAAALGVPVTLDEELAEALTVRTLERLVGVDGRRRLMLVGHDPDFSEMVAQLTGAERLAMEKGALARVDVGRTLGRGTGRLRWLVPPDLLDRG